MAITYLTGADGAPLVADVTGDPAHPGVLLLPGFAQIRQAWDATAKALVAAGRYVVVPDFRGHGESPWALDGSYAIDDFAADIVAIAKQMPSPPAIVGASFGGLLALIAIGEATSPIATALVLIDAVPQMADKELDRIAALWSLDAEGFGSAEEATAAMALHMPELPQDPQSVRRFLRRSDDGRFRWQSDPRARSVLIDRAGRAAARHRLEAAARAVDVPTLLVRGLALELVPDTGLAHFRSVAPNAECTDIGGNGATVVNERNDAFDDVILEFLERAVPRPGGSRFGGVDPATLRTAMGCFATGVTVITTRDAQGKPLGFTANSFTSVSLDPPLVLFCIKRDSVNVAALRSRGAFAVNVLHIGQQAISTRFASRVEDRFGDLDWEDWDHGVPIITEAMANFECSTDSILDGGDHFVVIGRVRRVAFDAMPCAIRCCTCRASIVGSMSRCDGRRADSTRTHTQQNDRRPRYQRLARPCGWN